MAGTVAASPKVASTVGLKDVVIAELTEDTEATLTYLHRCARQKRLPDATGRRRCLR